MGGSVLFFSPEIYFSAQPSTDVPNSTSMWRVVWSPQRLHNPQQVRYRCDTGAIIGTLAHHRKIREINNVGAILKHLFKYATLWQYIIDPHKIIELLLENMSSSWTYVLSASILHINVILKMLYKKILLIFI